MTPVVGALLAAWIFILSLAGVSPALHSWLHADDACAHACGSHAEEAPSEHSDADGHYCAVVALQGAVAPSIAMALPERSAIERSCFLLLNERTRSHTRELAFGARAPPIEI
jgi:hypothetical protein